MTLPLPQLDTRKWQDLVEDGIEIASRYSLGWTDHNVHDPGITLLELMAYKTEQSMYSANRVRADLLMKILAIGDATVKDALAQLGNDSSKLILIINKMALESNLPDILADLRAINGGALASVTNSDLEQLLSQLELEPVDGESDSSKLIAEIRKMANRANSSEILVDLAEQNGGTLDGLSKCEIQDFEPQQAVTANDYEWIAMNTPGVARACAFPHVDFEQSQLANAAGTLSIAIIPEREQLDNLNFTFDGIDQFADFAPLEGLRSAVFDRINEKRTIGTKVVVGFPKIQTLTIEKLDVGAQGKKDEVEEALKKFFHPYTGGSQKNGCPLFGRLTKELVLQKISEQIPEARVFDLHWKTGFPAWNLPVFGDDRVALNIEYQREAY